MSNEYQVVRIEYRVVRFNRFRYCTDFLKFETFIEFSIELECSILNSHYSILLYKENDSPQEQLRVAFGLLK